MSVAVGADGSIRAVAVVGQSARSSWRIGITGSTTVVATETTRVICRRETTGSRAVTLVFTAPGVALCTARTATAGAGTSADHVAAAGWRVSFVVDAEVGCTAETWLDAAVARMARTSTRAGAGTTAGTTTATGRINCLVSSVAGERPAVLTTTAAGCILKRISECCTAGTGTAMTVGYAGP